MAKSNEPTIKTTAKRYERPSLKRLGALFAVTCTGSNGGS